MTVARIARIDAVDNHFKPEVAHLSVMTIGELKGVSQKILRGDELVHRYSPGDLVVMVTSGAILPEDVLKEGFYDDEKQKGMLPGGKRGDRMKPTKFREQVSEFIMFPVSLMHADVEPAHFYIMRGELKLNVEEGQDVMDFLGITEFVP